ncbi:MAG: LysM peptidoglycan-binding domain-containing protein [Bacilli bacterium]|nr:LysM peptidoglycan-binding domain-containing protein [Bacilli bacterium]MDD4077260.1 LysM peptidoglycan-binding domain-containing protein [Bacilli bacterium]MDD4388326.1 LysM peptidoglycan-binding domain-containing protein [Bacilli bacterium]
MSVCPTGTFMYAVDINDTLGLIADKFGTTVEAILMVNSGINPDNLQIGQSISIPLAIEMPLPEPLYSELELNNRLRLLWGQYAGWLRLVTIFFIYDLPGFEDAYHRLLRVPNDVQNVFFELYGETVAEQSMNLFEENIIIAVRYLKAVKSSNKSVINSLTERWHLNTDEIGAHLVSINQYWTREEWVRLFSVLFDLIKAEILYLLSSDFEQSTLIYDEMENHVLEIAGVMFDGIVSQFPDCFS